ncbi:MULTISPECIES: hypothetical protein [unclassified Bartonella]
MRGERQRLEALVTQEEGMVGKSSGKGDKEAYQVCNEEDALNHWEEQPRF